MKQTTIGDGPGYLPIHLSVVLEDECAAAGLLCRNGAICVGRSCHCPLYSTLINDQCVQLGVPYSDPCLRRFNPHFYLGYATYPRRLQQGYNINENVSNLGTNIALGEKPFRLESVNSLLHSSQLSETTFSFRYLTCFPFYFRKIYFQILHRN